MNDIIELFNQSNHVVVVFNPFTFTNKSGSLHFRRSIGDFINTYPEKMIINISSAICVLNKNYMLGDTILVNGIFWKPFMRILLKLLKY